MNELFEKERIIRLSGDSSELNRIHNEMINMCGSEEEIISTLKLLVNKKAQDQDSIKKIIFNLYNENRSIEFYNALLSEVIESKIYLEEERLYISDHIKNLYGSNFEAGYNAIKDIPVETFTSLSERSRNKFIFEQFRLSLLLGAYSEADLISKKIRKSCMTEEEKPIFYKYYILLQLGVKAYLSAAEIYLEFEDVLLSPSNSALGSFYCMLSSCIIERKNIIDQKNKMLCKFVDSEKNDLLMRAYVAKFKSNTILGFELIDEIMEAFNRVSENQSDVTLSNENYNIYREEFKSSILEHNVLVVKKFASKIRIEDLSNIFKLTTEELINFISLMVNEKYTDIKINQITGIIDFGEKKFHSDIKTILTKIANATNLIHQDSIMENN